MNRQDTVIADIRANGRDLQIADALKSVREAREFLLAPLTANAVRANATVGAALDTIDTASHEARTALNAVSVAANSSHEALVLAAAAAMALLEAAAQEARNTIRAEARQAREEIALDAQDAAKLIIDTPQQFRERLAQMKGTQAAATPAGGRVGGRME